MKFIAHRGVSSKHKDNSISSIREAVENKYDGIEIDVQLCRSGELVLFHDLYTEDKFIRDMDIDEIRKYDICLLSEVYEKVPGIRGMLILMDIKGRNVKIVDALKLFYESESHTNITFCSFNRRILCTLPSSFRRGSTFEATFRDTEYDLVTRDMDAVVLHWTCLDKDFIMYCKSKNIRIYTYTHKNDMDLAYMYEYDIDGIITNGIA